MNTPDLKITSRILDRIPVRIILPAVLTLILFVLTIFLLLAPHFEARLMESKREMIRELIEVAWSTLNVYAEKEKAGELTRVESQNRAVEHLRSLRYGSESKDYFWINDMHPRIIMHPYRPELEGRDVSEFTDPSGKRLFVECVDIVKSRGSGYVDYEWQWKDDPGRIVPKISYVKGFEPWGWMVGTGVYVEDVRAGIADVSRRMTVICLIILVVVCLLLTYIIRYGVKVEKEKKRAEKKAGLRQEQLFQASKMVSLGTLVSGVAHEINNPITAVTLNTPTLQKAWKSVLPILDEYEEANGDFMVGGMYYSRIRERLPALISDIAEGARRVKEIVADLKDFARENPSEQSEDVDVNAVVDKASGLVNHLIKKSTDHFSVRRGESIPVIKGNTRRLEQVVINLIMNACQALPDNEKSVAVVTGYDKGAEEVFIEVSDEGTGVPENVLKQITDPFFTTRRDAGGTGLGLAISDRIVADHNGIMEFNSVPGRGTRVVVRLPV